MAGDKAMDIDQADASKASKVDMEKVTADVDAAKALAAQVCTVCIKLYGTNHAFQGKLSAAIEALLNIEKQQRLAEDVASTRMACSAILELFFQAKEYSQLREHIMLLSKRRSQLKQVIIDCLRVCKPRPCPGGASVCAAGHGLPGPAT